jgi:hypothetical protein
MTAGGLLTLNFDRSPASLWLSDGKEERTFLRGLKPVFCSTGYVGVPDPVPTRSGSSIGTGAAPTSWSGMGGRGLLLFFSMREAELLHLVAQRVAADVQELGRLDLVPV